MNKFTKLFQDSLHMRQALRIFWKEMTPARHLPVNIRNYGKARYVNLWYNSKFR